MIRSITQFLFGKAGHSSSTDIDVIRYYHHISLHTLRHSSSTDIDVIRLMVVQRLLQTRHSSSTDIDVIR